VPHVTLLLFDDEDEMRNVLSGVTSDNVLHVPLEYVSSAGVDRRGQSRGIPTMVIS